MSIASSKSYVMIHSQEQRNVPPHAFSVKTFVWICYLIFNVQKFALVLGVSGEMCIHYENNVPIHAMSHT